MVQGAWLLVILAAAIAFIIWGTASLRLHAFLVLLLAAYGVGLVAGMPAADVIGAITAGFGGTMGAIGIVIAAGTIIGFVLERNGGARVMAESVLKVLGEARSALAMAVTGAIVSIPVFCDSGFVILSPLNRSLAARAKKSMALYAVALSMGLYATHVFVPPTPGPIAAAGTLNADLGTVILLGLVVTIPVVAVTYWFATFMGRRVQIDPVEAPLAEAAATAEPQHRPSVLASFAPIAVPVILIALKSVADYPTHPLGTGNLAGFFSFIGHPISALLLGVFLAFWASGRFDEKVIRDWAGEGLKNAGNIVLITGAGGALGKVLQTTPIADYLGSSLATFSLGIFLPFLIAAALKTAQGSSTVAIITTAAIVSPLLPAMGLAGGFGPALVVLAIGAGSMTVSHANDSYFWVVSQFSGMNVAQAYQLQTISSGVAGVAGILSVWVLSLFLV
ncbi:GntP family permease [Limnochorda pilosa]|uniref:Gluconate transporter n=1 Tax=Limnochorda pilosa TaxID=1555112 RepID=A0A0K2SNH5_LIMPI|nr:GntP family permease [Limnochorda pilosa]BAS28646.1 gluconate transporter [Limnochorda pilosa]